jgi:hypothetical protein
MFVSNAGFWGLGRNRATSITGLEKGVAIIGVVRKIWWSLNCGDRVPSAAIQ